MPDQTLIGYARVSTLDQNLNLQLDALKKAGCTRIFTDKASGAKADRSGLNEALAAISPGDTLVTWRLDRVARSLSHLLQIVSALDKCCAGFKSLTESIDTTTASGRLVLHVFAALGEFERQLISERTTAGLAAARARGRVGGRPPALDTQAVRMAKTLLADPHTTVKQVCATLGVSKPTLYRSLERYKVQEIAT